MKKQEMLNFIGSILPEWFCFIEYVNGKKFDEKYGYYGAIVNGSNTDKIIMITINRKHYNWNDPNALIQSMLLHEIGHLMTNLQTDKTIMREVKAHKWALNFALKHNMWETRRYLKTMVKFWTTFTWNYKNGTYRRYIKAAQLLGV